MALPLLDGSQGALVTRDCLFQNDYAYALDILLSCGSERFNADLRLHTFKRHARADRRVFNDQLVTYRSGGQLWFDEYSTPRCVQVQTNGSLLMLPYA